MHITGGLHTTVVLYFGEQSRSNGKSLGHFIIRITHQKEDISLCHMTRSFLRIRSETRPVARKLCWGVLLKEIWTFSYCSYSANHSSGAVDKLMFYGVCIAHIHEGL